MTSYTQIFLKSGTVFIHFESTCKVLSLQVHLYPVTHCLRIVHHCGFIYRKALLSYFRSQNNLHPDINGSTKKNIRRVLEVDQNVPSVVFFLSRGLDRVDVPSLVTEKCILSCTSTVFLEWESRNYLFSYQDGLSQKSVTTPMDHWHKWSHTHRNQNHLPHPHTDVDRTRVLQS